VTGAYRYRSVSNRLSSNFKQPLKRPRSPHSLHPCPTKRRGVTSRPWRPVCPVRPPGITRPGSGHLGLAAAPEPGSNSRVDLSRTGGSPGTEAPPVAPSGRVQASPVRVVCLFSLSTLGLFYMAPTSVFLPKSVRCSANCACSQPGGVVVAERIKRRLSKVEAARSKPNLTPFGVVLR
jgi:hypothetical protein